MNNGFSGNEIFDRRILAPEGNIESRHIRTGNVPQQIRIQWGVYDRRRSARNYGLP